MSYWVYLQDRTAEPSYDPDDIAQEYPFYPAVEVDRHSEGGTYALGGTGEACLNVTYNYAKCWWPIWQQLQAPADGVGTGSLGQMLGEKRAADTIEHLARAVELLGTERDPDYWAATPGNAGAALAILLGWARQHPDAVWVVS